MSLEICVGGVRSFAELALVWPFIRVSPARNFFMIRSELYKLPPSPHVNNQSFLPVERLVALRAFELSDVDVRLHVARVVRFGVHREAADVALITFDLQVNDVQVIDDVRSVLESGMKV